MFIASINDINLTCGIPGDNKSIAYRNVTIVFMSLAAPAILMRMVKVAFMRHKPAIDDWFVGIAFLGSIAYCAVNLDGLVPYGLGRDIWSLPFDHVTKTIVFVYTNAALYVFEVGMVKLAMVLFYMNIFPSLTIRRILIGTFSFIAAYSFAYLMFCLFQCHPISYFWTSWDMEHKGTCAGNIKVIISHACLNIASDIWIMIIPMTQLARLNMDWRKKLSVGAMFSVGLLYVKQVPYIFICTFVSYRLTFAFFSITAVSICRLVSLVRSSSSINATYSQWSQYMWSTIEIYTSIICTCMPSMRLLFVRTGEYLYKSAISNSNSQKPSFMERSTISGIKSGKSGYEMHSSAVEKDDDGDANKGIMLSHSFFIDEDASGHTHHSRTPESEEHNGPYVHSTQAMV